MNPEKTFVSRLMQPSDWEEVARLIHQSLNVWHEKNRGQKLVHGDWSTMLVFPRVYEALDPNCCVLIEETASKRIAGSCFFHPRSRHVALGILNTHPDFFGRRVGSLLLDYVIEYAKREGKPLRLVSGTTNLDSFSLYNKAGFLPTCLYQDMILKVPEAGIPVDLPAGCLLRDATESDISEMVALELELSGIEREKDYRFVIRNDEKIWHTSVFVSSQDKIDGFLVSINDPGSNMLGPGVARTEEQAISLIQHELNFHRGRSPVWLVPSRSRKILDTMYRFGAKNCDLHVSQVLGEEYPLNGILFPTFMPETG